MFHPSLFQGSEGDLCYDKYVVPFLNGKKTRKRDDSVNFRLMQRSVVHFVPHRRIVLKKKDNIARIIAQIRVQYNYG